MDPSRALATTLACRQSFGIFLLAVQLLKKRSSQSRAFGPSCLISSVWMSSRPGALPFFNAVIPTSSSSAVKALVKPGSSGYRCRLIRTFGCLFGTLPLVRSWCATWFAVVLCSAVLTCVGRCRVCVLLTKPSCYYVSCPLIRSESAMIYGAPLRWSLSAPPLV